MKNLTALPLDAVLVLTGGDHFSQVLGALQNGLHVFVEKPMCFSLHEADQLIAAAQKANRVLMVGYMKRFDPGYQYAQECLAKMSGVRYVQMNTLHPSEDDYLAIHNLVRFNDVPPEVIQKLRAADDAHVREAVGSIPAYLANLYTDVFLGSMVHDINAMRGLLGEPEGVLFSRAVAR